MHNVSDLHRIPPEMRIVVSTASMLEDLAKENEEQISIKGPH